MDYNNPETLKKYKQKVLDYLHKKNITGGTVHYEDVLEYFNVDARTLGLCLFLLLDEDLIYLAICDDPNEVVFDVWLQD